MTSSALTECREYVQRELSAASDPEKAPRMQAYMKTDMPFYGVQQAGRTPILKGILSGWAPSTRDGYEALVTELWRLPHREEKYLALGVAVKLRQFITPASLPLYKRLIVEGAWWDFVDEVATHLVGPLVLGHPEEVWPEVDAWITDPNFWLRRSAIICQLGAKERTDVGRLLHFCESAAHDTEFFIRKAIGWALREYAKTDPVAVAAFVSERRSQLSGLSVREATKHIGDLVS